MFVLNPDIKPCHATGDVLNLTDQGIQRGIDFIYPEGGLNHPGLPLFADDLDQPAGCHRGAENLKTLNHAQFKIFASFFDIHDLLGLY